MINFIVWLITGGLIGWIASMIMPTNTKQGALGNTLGNIIVGIIGAFLAGMFLSPLFGTGTINQNDLSILSLLVSLLGAIILLGIVNLFRRNTADTQEVHKNYERTTERELSSSSRFLIHQLAKVHLRSRP
jgi:uncharacterized membrane protein YeaQ/YmgE (transglycosylase-associated protein family)